MAHAAVSALDLGGEKQLLQFFPEPVRLHLLYKVPNHGFKMSDLISKFDQEGRFIVIVYLESGTMKGGYMSKRPGFYCQEDRGAFVFEIDHQKANVFPVVNHHNSIIFNREKIGFGGCLNIYSNKDKTLCVDVGFDDTYTPTDWSDEFEVPFMVVELHRIQSVGDVLLNPWRELSWTEKERGSLRKNLVSFKPACQSEPSQGSADGSSWVRKIQLHQLCQICDVRKSPSPAFYWHCNKGLHQEAKVI